MKLELDISQDDYIEVEILEQALEAQLWKKSLVKTFAVETILSVLAAVLVLILAKKGIVLAMVVWFVPFIWMFFLFHFVYNYYRGVKREFNMAVQHLLKAKDTQQFFSPERGMAYFYEDKCEFLTNEQRRYFNYDKIKHIKEIRHLYIFVMKRSKEKNMQGFAYMVIPKRNLFEHQQQDMEKIIGDIIKKYDLKPWVDSDILG